MRIKRDIQEGNEKDKDFIRPFPLWGMLACGTILVLIGIYSFMYNVTATDSGILNHPRFSGGHQAIINGQTIMVFGLLMCVFPVYQLLRQRKR